jgi:hypothetical protein
MVVVVAVLTVPCASPGVNAVVVASTHDTTQSVSAVLDVVSSMILVVASSVIAMLRSSRKIHETVPELGLALSHRPH